MADIAGWDFNIGDYGREFLTLVGSFALTKPSYNLVESHFMLLTFPNLPTAFC